MSGPKFAVGDRVRCVDVAELGPTLHLVLDKEYVVDRVSGAGLLVSVEGIDGAYFAVERFEPVETDETAKEDATPGVADRSLRHEALRLALKFERYKKPHHSAVIETAEAFRKYIEDGTR